MKFKAKLFLAMSMLSTCFVINNIDNNNHIVHAQDFSNLNFDSTEMKKVLPSGYFRSNEDSNKQPSFDSSGRYLLTNGGETKYLHGQTEADIAKGKNGKRWLGFTLTQDIELEIGIYCNGNKQFAIADDKGIVSTYTTVQSSVASFTYKFQNIPSSGKNFYFGGASSGIYIDYISFGVIQDKAKFDANGGRFSDGSTRKVVVREEGADDTVTPPENPTFGDYVFAGWSESKTGSTVTTYEYNKTYYATWKSVSGMSIYLDNIYLKLRPDDDPVKLNAYVLPSIPNPVIAWSSSNVAVATVDQEGNVTAIANGECQVTAKYGKASASCKIEVKEYIERHVKFYDEKGDLYQDISVEDGETVQNLPVFGTGKGYRLTWKTKDGKAFTGDTKITSDVEVYASVDVINVATQIELEVTDTTLASRISDRDYYLKAGYEIQLSYKLSRDDDKFEEVSKTSEFNASKNDIKWYSTDTNIATVSANGMVKMLKTGRVEIYAKMYEETQKQTKYQKDNILITSPTFYFSCLDEAMQDETGRIYSTRLSLKSERGRFQATGDTEKAVRFIGIIDKTLFPYIDDAKFVVRAIDKNNIVRKTFTYDVEYFSEKITYESKVVYSSYFKEWESEGKLGCAFTITNLPTNEFVGKFECTFMVKEVSTQIYNAITRTISYDGI